MAGLVFYHLYTYAMYAFSPFTDVFLAYVAIMGMSAHGLLDGLLRVEVGAVAEALRDASRRAPRSTGGSRGWPGCGNGPCRDDRHMRIGTSAP